jgi:hypothetical protein
MNTKKYMSISCQQTTKQSNISLQNAAKLKNMGITATYQDCTHEEIKFGKCLLPFNSEFSVFTSNIE